MGEHEIDDGGPAFPQHTFLPAGNGGGQWTNVGGASLRDWLAGTAPISWRDAVAACGWPRDFEVVTDQERAAVTAILAMMRFEYADAMIAARKGGAA